MRSSSSSSSSRRTSPTPRRGPSQQPSRAFSSSPPTYGSRWLRPPATARSLSPASAVTSAAAAVAVTAPTATPYQQPLLLTVRFSVDLPDLLLDIPRPATTTVVALKHLIRRRLAEPSSQRRLRFIHGGKILPDGAVLSAVLRPPPPPPSLSSSLHGPGENGDPRGKGKAIEGSAGPPQRVYVNCSIGDSLTDEELRAEAEAAEAPAVPSSTTAAAARHAASAHGKARAGPGLQIDTGGGAVQGGLSTGAGGAHRAAGTGTQQNAPRGFDRLLSTGFTTAEVNQLRLQFRSIQATRHTPDTMPSPDTLRSMEDAWIDNNNNDAGSGGGGGGGLGSGGAAGAGVGAHDAAAAEEFGLNGLLDAMIPGMLIGFVMPLATVAWLVREEGLLSKRWRVLMTFGFVLSLTIGFVRALSSDHE